MKRTICVVLALVLALSLALAGCQSNSTSSSGSSSDSQSASGSGSESQELEPVVLEYYCMGTVAKDNDMVYEAGPSRAQVRDQEIPYPRLPQESQPRRPYVRLRFGRAEDPEP